jgi:hypothetical protein
MLEEANVVLLVRILYDSLCNKNNKTVRFYFIQIFLLCDSQVLSLSLSLSLSQYIVEYILYQNWK